MMLDPDDKERSILPKCLVSIFKEIGIMEAGVTHQGSRSGIHRRGETSSFIICNIFRNFRREEGRSADKRVLLIASILSRRP